jgi:plastocyanin
LEVETMRKLAILLGTAALVAVTSVSAGASSGTVAVRGGEQFEPNALIQSTFRFSPGSISATSGQTVTWVDEDRAADEPHTITVVNKADLPTDIEEVFECDVCADALFRHFGAGVPVPVLNAGGSGFDAPGDSLLMLPGESVSAVISAPAGTTLYYLCALHPWMQGSIAVG